MSLETESMAESHSSPYRTFQELEEAEQEGEAWIRDHRDRGSRTLVMAPHGGWIEPMTTELAAAVAGEDLSFYSFMAIKDQGNDRLHLTSTRFDDPVAVRAASEADRVLAIHGEKTTDDSFIMVGGGSEELRRLLEEALAEAGFSLREPRKGLGGRHMDNICNRGGKGGGGQLELSEGLRGELRERPDRLGGFVEAIRSVLLPLEEG